MSCSRCGFDHLAGMIEEEEDWKCVAYLKRELAEARAQRDDWKMACRRADQALLIAAVDVDKLRQELAAARAADKPVCCWKYDENNDTYETSCGEAWCFMEGDIAENKVRFCPHCGGAVHHEAAKAAGGGDDA